MIARQGIDDPATTIERINILQAKHFLKKIYEEWYAFVISALPGGMEPVLELGSGAGFLQTLCPEVIRSEIFFCPGINMVADGCALPFRNDSLRAIVFTDVLHHISRPALFFEEASRCVKSGGRVIMVEPWVSALSTVIYKYFHHEPFDPRIEKWEFISQGPLSDANGALPWIIFERDRQVFSARFPEWDIQVIKPFMSCRYLLSGGFSRHGLMPARTFYFWKMVEQFVEKLTGQTAMFAKIIIEKR